MESFSSYELLIIPRLDGVIHNSRFSNSKYSLFIFFYGQINIGTNWILRFQNGCSKVQVIELSVVQFWSEIIPNWRSALVRF